MCTKIYSTKNNLQVHKCKNKSDYMSDDLVNISNIIKEIPDVKDKQIVINITNNNINSNNNKQNVKNVKNVNSNNKISNKVNFFDTNPKNFMFDYNVSDNIKNEFTHLLKLDEYNEEIIDKYMYEEENFRKEHRELLCKYDKEVLQSKGMEVLFTKLQQDPINRNVMIRKTKSGKCYIYNAEWVEEKLQKIITKICNKLCDTLYDKETSTNHFIRLVLGSQPKRCKELRKHIENEIINNNAMMIE